MTTEDCKQLKERLEKTESELADLLDILDSLKDAVIFIDKNKKIVYLNKIILELGQYKKEEIVGKKITEISKMISPKSYPRIMAALAKRLIGMDTPPYEVILRKKNGEEFFVEVLGSPLYKEGRIVGSVAVLRDVTDRKLMEEELKRRNEELERLNKTMIGRELKMIELKHQIKKLEKKIKKKKK